MQEGNVALTVLTAEFDMFYYQAQPACVLVFKNGQRYRDPSRILCKKFTQADLYINILILLRPQHSPDSPKLVQYRFMLGVTKNCYGLHHI